VTLGNPFGPFVRGIDAVMSAVTVAAGRIATVIMVFERIGTYIGEDLACIAEVERFRARVSGSDTTAEVALRVSSTFRREDGMWKLVHRHTDAITTAQSADSVIQQECHPT
jgi:hypothetical protein